MKSIFFTVVLTFLSLSALATPHPQSFLNNAKKPKPNPKSPTASNATFIPPAPHFSVYSDKWFGSNSPPPVSKIEGFNVFLLSFLLLSGPADQAVAFTQLDAATRAKVISDYHNAGIAIMVSAFGSTDAPTSVGADPVDTANTMAAWVKEFGLDGIDVDYEDFNAIDSGTGEAENWLIDFTKQLRKQLPAGQFIITHAPIAPWLTDSTTLYPHGAYHAVAKAVGNDIDWWHVQFYNQGKDYTSCDSLLTTSESDFPHTSIFEINKSTGVPLSKLLIGKPASAGDASTGFMDANTLAGCLAQGKKAGWSGGAMFWEYPEATASFISTVRSKSWPV